MLAAMRRQRWGGLARGAAAHERATATTTVLLLLGLAVGAASCRASGVAAANDATGSRQAPGCPQPLAATLSVAQALQAPMDQPLLFAGVLCEDLSQVPCPPCPEGADCARCLDPDWVFCDMPPISDYGQTLSVRSLPGLELTVGRRYLVSGARTAPRGLAAQSVCDPGP